MWLFENNFCFRMTTFDFFIGDHNFKIPGLKEDFVF